MSLNNLGMSFPTWAAGRRIAATEEAVDIRRELAEAMPEAFLPDLASSLGTYGSILVGPGTPWRRLPNPSLRVCSTCSPFYRNLPQAFSSLAKSLLRDYLQACRKAEQEPDKELLAQFGDIKLK